MTGAEWLEANEYGLRLEHIYNNTLQDLVLANALTFLVMCNYGEGRSTQVVKDLIDLGVGNIAYVIGGLTAISKEPNPNVLIAQVSQVPHRMVVLTRTEVHDHRKIINMLGASIHSDMGSAYQYIQNRQ
jgi:hypothetical protein